MKIKFDIIISIIKFVIFIYQIVTKEYIIKIDNEKDIKSYNILICNLSEVEDLFYVSYYSIKKNSTVILKQIYLLML